MEHCLSCNKYVTKVKSVKPTLADNEILNDLIKAQNISEVEFKLCVDCFDLILKKNQRPPYSILNNMYLDPVPKEILILNFYEKLLIQQAKCFLTIIQLKPHQQHQRHVLPGLKGLAAYLPLNLEDTHEYISKTLPDTNMLNFLVNGLPTKNNKIWRGLINVVNVCEALNWLKNNNPLYKNIQIDLSELKNYSTLDNIPLDGSYLVTI